MASGTICTNFKTIKKSILGKYDLLKTSGMVWATRSSPIYVNFDLHTREEEFTQKLAAKLKQYCNKKHRKDSNFLTSLENQQLSCSTYSEIKNIDDDRIQEKILSNSNDNENKCLTNNNTTSVSQESALLNNLYTQVEEITRKITFLIKNAAQNGKDQELSEDPNIILRNIDDLKVQRRLLWEQIEREESAYHSIIPFEQYHNFNTKLEKVEEIKEFPSEKSEDSISVVKEESYYLCSCINNCIDDEVVKKNQKESPKLRYDHNYQIITDMMKNVFYCYTIPIDYDGLEIELTSNEQLLISKEIDHITRNFVINEKDIRFISTDLCYLIPGMIQEGITIIILVDDQSQNSKITNIASIEKKVQYLKEKCKINAGKIIESADILETSSILTGIIKNEIKFLYITYEAIDNNSKLIGILNVAKSQNNITRIVFIIGSAEENSSCIGIPKSKIDYQNMIKSIIDKIPGIPILIISKNLAISNLNFLSIPLEIVEAESDEGNKSIGKKKKDSFLSKIRNNLYLEVMQKKSPLLTKNMEDILNWLINNHYLSNTSKMSKYKESSISGISGYGIIFSMTNRDAESINTWLNKNGVPAAFFHSKMNELQQKEVILNWESGGIKIVVIANVKNSKCKELNNENEFQEKELINEPFYKPFASKLDIRFVVHYSIPQSFSDYIDQVNIAGQDGFIAHSLVMFNEIDVKIIQRIISVLPNDDENVESEKKIEEEFRAIVEYCTNDDDNKSANLCRRVEIMKHYDLNFQYQDCFCMCDRCEEQAAIEEMKNDTTVHANNMLKIINVLNVSKDTIKILPTLKTIIDIYVGNKCIKKKVCLNNNQEDESVEEIVPCAFEFKGKREILLNKTIKELCNREILKISTKKIAHGSINYFEANKSIEEIEEPIFV